MIICCGENLIDMVPATGPGLSEYGSFRVAPGGCPYNSAIAAARLGADVAFLGKIASDFLGDKLYGRLVENGVGTELVVRADCPVTLAFVEKSPAGEAHYAFYSEGAADRSLSDEDIPEQLPPDTHFLLVGSISLLLEPAASAIFRLLDRESSRLMISFDPNVRASLIPDKNAFLHKFEAICARSSILKASDTDLEWLYSDSAPSGLKEPDWLIDKALNLGVTAVFLTRGDKGSIAATAKVRIAHHAMKVDVIDTIGAGDTFHAAILCALELMDTRGRKDLEALTAADLERILNFATAAAAINCMREGSDPPLMAELVSAFPDCMPREVNSTTGGKNAHRH